MKDYLIVGAGLAGLAFAEVAIRNGKSVRIYEDASQDASSVAAGLYNPVAIKRLKAVPGAGELIDEMNSFYERVHCGQDYRHKLPLVRRFNSAEEQNSWFEAADAPSLGRWLVPRLPDLKIKAIESPFGFGEVRETGYVDTRQFLQCYRDFLEQQDILVRDSFDYRELSNSAAECLYKAENYRFIVFAEGFGLHKNPYFDHLPLNGTKGEILLIRSEHLHLDVIVNSGIFILPLGNCIYRVGATYEHQDKTNIPTPAGRAELEQKLKTVLQCEFEVIGHEAGVRPTTRDRQPLLGTHPAHPHFAILNGLGTRGVLFAPTLAKLLYVHLEEGKPIPSNYDISRFRR